MGLGRRVTRRRSGTPSIVPVVVLGAVVSLGVVAVTASRFGWRRTKAEKNAFEEPQAAPEAEAEVDGHVLVDAPLPEVPAPRFKPGPPRERGALRWDSPPAELAAAAPDRAKPDPPSP